LCPLVRAGIENNLHGIVLSHACLACAYVGDGQTQRAVFQAGKAIEAACGYRPTRQERYFPIAAQILDEAIMLGAQGHPARDHAATRLLVAA
jgi:hypothetical protein